jgi:hypothetical protein
MNKPKKSHAVEQLASAEMASDIRSDIFPCFSVSAALLPRDFVWQQQPLARQERG